MSGIFNPAGNPTNPLFGTLSGGSTGSDTGQGEGQGVDPAPSASVDTGQGEGQGIDPAPTAVIVLGIYDAATVRGLVRFWLQDTACTVWSDTEIDILLWHAQYGGTGNDLWATTGDAQVYVFDQVACPHHYLNHWDWLNWWDRACTPYYTRTLRLSVLLAAAYGWESAANDAALCARIRRTGLFETDTWTTYKAVQARADAMKKLANGQSQGIVLSARRPIESYGLIW